MIKVLLLSIIILGLGLLGFSIKLLIDRKAVFKGSGCQSYSKELQERGIDGCCGGACREESRTE
jgi:hypothetical protein